MEFNQLNFEFNREHPVNTRLFQLDFSNGYLIRDSTRYEDLNECPYVHKWSAFIPRSILLTRRGTPEHTQAPKSYIERVKDRLSKRKSAQSSGTGDDETFDWRDMIHQSREVQKKIGDFGTRPRNEDDIAHKPTCKYYRGNGESSSKQAEVSIKISFKSPIF